MHGDWQWFFQLSDEKILPPLANQGYRVIHKGIVDSDLDEVLDWEEPPEKGAHIMYQNKRNKIFSLDILFETRGLLQDGVHAHKEFYWLRASVSDGAGTRKLKPLTEPVDIYELFKLEGWVCLSIEDVGPALDEIVLWIEQNLTQ
jgi:hypothetical protein